MPLPVKIDSLYFKLSPFGNEKLLTARFLDPANTVNYYRLIEFINNEQQQRFNVANDELNNGNVIDYSFRPQGGNDTIMVKGANVTVWLESIDKGVYEYFRTAGRDGGQSASPANPTSNFSNGALGYFSACAMTQKGIKVP
jgi:hypothetical protein